MKACPRAPPASHALGSAAIAAASDRTCVNGTEEWVADFILMCICNDVVAEDVDAAFLHGQPAAFAPASAPTLSSHTDVTVRGGVGE